MLRLIWGVGTAFLVALLLVSIGFAEPCPKQIQSSKTEKAYGCEIVTHKGQFNDGQKTLAFVGSVLSCGGQPIVDTLKRVYQEAKQICQDVSENASPDSVDYAYSVTLEFVSNYKNLVSVLESVSGYTGGAHEFAHVQRVTYDKKTGSKLTIPDIFGEQAAQKIFSSAKKKFDQTDSEKRDLYDFSMESFSVESWGNDQVKIVFASPHRIEIARGSTLDVSVIFNAPGEDIPGKPGAEGENAKGIACVKRGEYDCAIKHFKKAIQIEPTSTVPYNGLSLVYKKNRKYFDCITWGRIAESISLEDEALGEARHNIAECYRLSGNPNLACEYYRKSLEVRPENGNTLKQCDTYCGDCLQ